MTSVTFRSAQPTPADPAAGSGSATPAALRITRGEPTEEQLAAVTAALLALCTRRPAPAPAEGGHGHRRARWSQEPAPCGAGSWRLPDPPR